MIKLTAYLLAFSCLSTIAEDTREYPVFDASDTKLILDKIGQKITVKGIVSDAKKSKGGTSFIRFKNSEFYLVVFKSDLNAFKDRDFADLYQGEHLAVTGVVSIFKNKPQMKLIHPEMVKIISEGGSVPAPVKEKKRTTPKKQLLPPSSGKTTSDIKKQTPPVDSKKYFK